MSLPHEHLHAQRETWRFLNALATGEAKRVPSAVREWARRCARHYALNHSEMRDMVKALDAERKA